MDAKEIWNKAYHLHHHGNSMNDINEAIRLYQNILASFPQSEEAKSTNYQLPYAIAERKRYENGSLIFSDNNSTSAINARDICGSSQFNKATNLVTSGSNTYNKTSSKIDNVIKGFSFIF